MYIYMKELYLYKSVYHSINPSTTHFKAEFIAIITSNREVDYSFSFFSYFIGRPARRRETDVRVVV